MKLDGGAFLLQWAAGGMFFGWVTTRRREVGLGYGWLLRATFGALALGAAAVFATGDRTGARTVAAIASVLVAGFAAVALASSVLRRATVPRGREASRARGRARVAAMMAGSGTDDAGDDGNNERVHGREFEPALDLLAPLAGVGGLLVAAQFAGGPYALAAARLLVGAAFLGAATDAMLLGHWYLVQPGLRRDPIKELVRWTAWCWPIEVAAFLWPTGMTQVFTGAVDDGYGGLLGWIWAVSAFSTIALVGVTWLALRERFYSAVMAATGLLYLAILTAFGTDLVARAVLAP